VSVVEYFLTVFGSPFFRRSFYVFRHEIKEAIGLSLIGEVTDNAFNSYRFTKIEISFYVFVDDSFFQQ
jgi:hypothetical protein